MLTSIVKFAKQGEFPGGQLRALREAEAPILPPLAWQSVEEPLEGPNGCTQRIVDHVFAGHSMCVLGAAGAGKIVCQMATKEALEAAGQICLAICLTHAGTRSVGQLAVIVCSFAAKFVMR